MSRHHDKWYTRIFSDPKIVEELLRSFVHEDFVQELDFSSLKKLNTKFIPVSEKSRHADVVYEIKSHGQSAYIYLFLEFQSTVDRFLALRMGRYIFEFYQEIQRLIKSELLNPPFPIRIHLVSLSVIIIKCLNCDSYDEMIGMIKTAILLINKNALPISFPKPWD